MSDIWAERFNPVHAPAGSAAGGQFAAASGSSSGGKAKAARPTPSNQHPVGQGETGKRVSDLQSRLNALGFKPPLKVDGIFGPKTLAAVKAFQVSHGLRVDGLVGPKTTAALRSGKHPPAHKPAHHKPPHHKAPATAKPAPATKPAAPAKPAPMAKPAPPAVRGSDLNHGPGSKLWDYWTRGAGLAKWSGATHKWTALRDLLLAAGVPASSADGLTTNIITAVMPGYMKQAHAKAGHAGRADMATDTQAKPYGKVAYADPKNGKYPIDTEAHVRAAWSYINMPKNASQYPMNGVTLSEVKARIKAAMDKLGADVGDSETAKDKASASRTEYMRLYALEDIHILRSADGGDGRTVEAYAAVFGEPAEIQDHEGHYVEVIDRGAFNRAIDHASRGRGGFPGSVKVLWNHGRDLSGAASDRFSMPIGIPVDIRAESRGLLTRTRYSETPLADEVLENIRAGSITSQSFTGRIMRSNPQLARGDRYRPDSAGNLRTVSRTELGLREYGPVLWPAYSGAEILGVRMSTPGTYALDPDELEDEALPPDGEPAAGDPLTRTDGDDEHSARYHQHSLFVLRSKEAREKAGLVW